jgi:hypothetical protein
MWERRWGWAVLGVSALFLVWGGSAPALAFEAENRLLVQSIESVTGGGGFVFSAVEKTDDSGGVAGTEGENDGFPDPGEVIQDPLGNDLAKVTLKNEPRPGVETGVDLTVYRVDITYLDASGNSHAFAPRFTYQQSQLIPTGGTADLQFVIVPYSMKVPSAATVRGLRDIFLYPVSPSEVDQVSRWTASIDIYARDKLNGDTVHTRTDQSISFINPNAQQ